MLFRSRNAGRADEALAFYEQAAAHPDIKSLALYDQFLIHLYQRRFAEADRCVRASIESLPTTNNLTGSAMLELAWHGQADTVRRTLAAAPAEFRGEPRMVFATALPAAQSRRQKHFRGAGGDRGPDCEESLTEAWRAVAREIGRAHV